jgi:integrase
MKDKLPENVKRLHINHNPSAPLTQRIVDDAQPRLKPYFIRDAELKGFGVRINPQGSKSYIAEARIGGTGRPIRWTIGRTDLLSLKNARIKARDVLNEIAQGVNPKTSEDERRAKEIRLGELIEQYYEQNSRIKENRRAEYIREARTVLKPLLNIPAAELSSSQYLAFYRKNSQKKPVYMDKIHRQLKAVYNHAVAKEIVEKNPTLIVTKTDKPIPKPKGRRLDLGSELEAFLKATISTPVSTVARDAILIFLATGMRRTELLALKWDEVDFERYLIIKPDTKNRQEHIVPMSNLVRLILTSRHQSPDRNEEYVFPSRAGGHLQDLRKPILRINQAAGLDKTISLHDFRRTFTALAQDSGISEDQIKNLLNHIRSDVTNKFYMAAAGRIPTVIKERRGLLNQISERIEDLTTGESLGIRWRLYEDSMFEDEKTEDGVHEYFYAMEKEKYERIHQRKLSHEDIKGLDPEAYEARNLDLERAYDWEW